MSRKLTLELGSSSLVCKPDTINREMTRKSMRYRPEWYIRGTLRPLPPELVPGGDFASPGMPPAARPGIHSGLGKHLRRGLDACTAGR